MTELVDIYDEHWNPTGEILDRREAERARKWRKSVVVWIINSRGEILFQQRMANKILYPSHWAASAAGCPRVGESDIDAMIRETREELGIELDPKELIEFDRYNMAHDSHLRLQISYMYFADLSAPADFSFEDGEVADVKYFPWRELAVMSDAEMRAAKIVPQKELRKIYEYLEKEGF
ncbi:MAG: NUDIX domain-containing protein [Alphaproteobacteria bacterium]|nr:NUDIX domain-containing protein [Alphaproteobacteria bacterium]